MNCADLREFSVLLLSSGDLAHEVTEALRSCGIGAVRIAGDADAAMTVLDNGQFDLVICEGDAGWAGALGAVRRIRAATHEGSSLVPIVMLASDAPVQKVVQARNAGAHRIIHRPLAGQGLAQELVDLVDNPRPFVRCGAYFGPIRAAELRPSRADVRVAVPA